MNRTWNYYLLRLRQFRRDLIALFFSFALPLTATLVVGWVSQGQGEVGRAYFQLFFPGILGFTLVMLGLSGMGSYLLSDRQRGVTKKFKAIDPNPRPYLLGLGLSRLTVLLVLLGLLAVVASLLFGYRIVGPWPAALAFQLLGGGVFLALGLLVAAASPTLEAASSLSAFLQLFFIVTGELFFSLSGWPTWLREILAWTPLNAFTTGFAQVAAGQEIGLWARSLAVLGGWLVVLVPLSLRSFRW